MSGPACTWCGHPSHGVECGQLIVTRRGTRTRETETAPCPCARGAGGRWQDRAACLDPGIAVEFLARPEDEQIETCHRCPVRRECLEYGQQAGLSMVVYAGRRPTRWPQPPRDERWLTYSYSGYGI